jgi:hypothetical protein
MTNVSGQLVSPILGVQESKRKHLAPIWGLHREQCGQLSANRVVASGWMEECVLVFLLCYSAGLQLPLSYSFVVDYHSLIQYFPSSHFTHVECSPVSLYHRG